MTTNHSEYADLLGTARQIEWALTIRRDMQPIVEAMEARALELDAWATELGPDAERAAGLPTAAAAIRAAHEFLQKTHSAEAWIEHRVLPNTRFSGGAWTPDGAEQSHQVDKVARTYLLMHTHFTGKTVWDQRDIDLALQAMDWRGTPGRRRAAAPQS